MRRDINWGPVVSTFLLVVFVAALAAIAILLIAQEHPSKRSAFVLHTVSDSCDDQSDDSLLMLHDKVVKSGFGRTSRIEPQQFTALSPCTEADSGTAIQAWGTDRDWKIQTAFTIQIGFRPLPAKQFIVSDRHRLRIDYDHVFVGTLDMRGDAPQLMLPDAEHRTALAGRQGCDPLQNWFTDCGTEWKSADPLTFAVQP